MSYKSGTIGTISAFFLRNFYEYIHSNQKIQKFQNEARLFGKRAMPHGTPNMAKTRD
jgi:hypothetical protein